MVEPHNAIIPNNTQEENYIMKVNYNLRNCIKSRSYYNIKEFL